MGKSKSDKTDDAVVFGLALIAIGVVFLLDELGVIGIREVWTWWPWLFIGVGVVRAAMWRSAKTVASGFGMVLFGLWFLISVEGWFGLGWSDSWPLAVVAIGLSMVARAALEPLFRDRSVEEVERNA